MAFLCIFGELNELKVLIFFFFCSTTEDDIIVDQVTSQDIVDDFELGKDEVG